MSSYEVSASREGAYWTLDVPGVGTTQSRTLDEAVAVVTDYVELLADDDSPSVSIKVVDRRAGAAVEAHRRLTEATAAQAQASADLRAAVVELREAGVTLADVGSILHISPQRVSQLAAARSPAERRVNVVQFPGPATETTVVRKGHGRITGTYGPKDPTTRGAAHGRSTLSGEMSKTKGATARTAKAAGRTLKSSSAARTGRKSSDTK